MVQFIFQLPVNIQSETLRLSVPQKTLPSAGGVRKTLLLFSHSSPSSPSASSTLSEGAFTTAGRAGTQSGMRGLRFSQKVIMLIYLNRKLLMYIWVGEIILERIILIFYISLLFTNNIFLFVSFREAQGLQIFGNICIVQVQLLVVKQ